MTNEQKKLAEDFEAFLQMPEIQKTALELEQALIQLETSFREVENACGSKDSKK